MAGVEVLDGGGVRTIRLNRPERLNALGVVMREGLEVAVAETARAEARVVVFEGAGRAFSAGADLSEGGRASADQPGWQSRRRTAGAWGRLLTAIEELPQVTVGSLHGHVVGGAVLLAVACDLRVADDDTLFRIPELALGIPLTWGGVPRLVREVGVSRTRELVLTGRAVGARVALEWGLAHRVGDRQVETTKLVEELVSMPAAPLAVTKEALRAYGRTVVSHEAAWADADLLDATRREPESAEAARRYATALEEQRRQRRE